jgi:hypothetical protein
MSLSLLRDVSVRLTPTVATQIGDPFGGSGHVQWRGRHPKKQPSPTKATQREEANHPPPPPRAARPASRSLAPATRHPPYRAPSRRRRPPSPSTATSPPLFLHPHSPLLTSLSSLPLTDRRRWPPRPTAAAARAVGGAPNLPISAPLDAVASPLEEPTRNPS